MKRLANPSKPIYTKNDKNLGEKEQSKFHVEYFGKNQ